MKIFNQIIVVIVLIGIIFIVKSDYKIILSKTQTFLKDRMGISTDFYKNTLDGVKVAINTKYKNTITNKVETPGALIVSKDYLTNNVKNIKLSIKGIINITNIQRADNGKLTALIENPKLDFSAEKKLQDMFTKGYFEHISPDGVGVSDLSEQAGYEYLIIGENLAMGNFIDDKALLDAWMASPGHRANILNQRYTEIGVAVAKGEYKGDSVWMAVQHFGLPKSACPSIDEVLKGTIDIDQKNIRTMENEIALKKAIIDSGAVAEGMTTNEQINNYNVLVNNYNQLILDIKEKINKFNLGVKSFNACIAQVN